MRFRGWLHVVAIGCLAGTMSVFAAGSPLIDAVKKQDVQAVRSPPEAEVDLNATEADGFTALHWAAQRNNLQLVDLLLSAGANAKATTATTSRRSTSPPSTATPRSWSGCLNAGADPNGDRGGRSDDADDGGAVGEGGCGAGCC